MHTIQFLIFSMSVLEPKACIGIDLHELSEDLLLVEWFKIIPELCSLLYWCWSDVSDYSVVVETAQDGTFQFVVHSSRSVYLYYACALVGLLSLLSHLYRSRQNDLSGMQLSKAQTSSYSL